MRDRIELIGLGAAALIVAAFLFSFLTGLGVGGPAPAPAPPPQRVVADPPTTPAAEITVEVLNGSGRTALARAIAGRLREAGFDVVGWGNAARAADSSAVLARRGDESAAHAVARHLGIDNVLSRPDSTLLLDVTVILGKDWPEPASSPGGR